MKNLKLLGVLLVGLILPTLVNADTAVINDVDALKSCVETSDICQLNADIEVKDIDFNKGTIEIPEGKTLTISGNTKASSDATIIVNGTIVIKSGAILDASKMSFGASTGLVANQSGKLTIEENGTFIGLDYWEQAYQDAGGWSPLIGNHLFLGCEVGAVVMSGVNTYVLTSENWKGFVKVGNEYYTTLQDAIDAVPNGVETTLEVLNSVSTPGFITSNGKNVVIDLKGNEIKFTKPLKGSSGTETQNMQLLKGSTVTLKNGTIRAAKEAKRLLQNYSNLTLENITLDATTMDLQTGYALSFNNGKVNIKGNTNIYAHDYAFDVYYWTINNGKPTSYLDGTQVTIDTTGTIKGNIEVSGDATPSKSTLYIINVNHEGDFNVIAGYEDNIKILGGTYTKDVNSYLKDKENNKAILDDGKYSIYEKFDIIGDLEPENGTIVLDKCSAFYKDEVNIKVTPNEGSIVESISVIDFYNNPVEVKDNKFIMPKTEAFVSVEFAPIQNVSTPEVNEDNTIGVSNALKTENILLDTLAQEDKYKDLSVTVEVVVDDIEVDENIGKEFNEALAEDDKKDGKIVSYFDITIAVRNSVTDKVEGYLTELTEKVEFKVALPELDEVEEGYTRSFYVIKKHGTTVSILDAKLSSDGKYIIFETDEFSTYALAYEDTVSVANDESNSGSESDKETDNENDSVIDDDKDSVKDEISEEVEKENKTEDKKEDNIEVPKTFDGITTTLILGFIALISFVGISFYLKKELSKKNN